MTKGIVAQSSCCASDRRGSSPGLVSKSPRMILLFLVLWFLVLFLYGPRLWAIGMSGENLLEKAALLSFAAMLVVFWMFAAYHISVVLFAFASPCGNIARLCEESDSLPVAMLCPICNDFQADAAATWVNQDYPDFHVFILDDSTEQKFMNEVDAFHARHFERTTVVRRSVRKGFKAGNLNSALRGPAAKYPFFAVVDADERLSKDFLSKTGARMLAAGAAFVQANHKPNPHQESSFSRDLGPTILPFWNVYCRPRNRYGFVLYLGHGVLVRRSSWEAVGGFPETVLEDLAFSAVLGTQGLRGVFAPDIICNEDFPPSYGAFKRQHERYIVGVTQVMRHFLVPLLKSRWLRWYEKMDFCLWCSPLYVPALCLLFGALTGLVLPLLLGNWQNLTLTFAGHSFRLLPLLCFGDRFQTLWTWDFQLVALVTAFSPAFGCLALGIRKKVPLGRLLLVSTVPYLSLMIVSWRGILRYLLLGKTFSPPTGESTPEYKSRPFTPGPQEKRATWSPPAVSEVMVGGLLAVAAFFSFNFCLCGVAGCVLVGGLVGIRGWEQPSARFACALCFLLILIQAVLNLTLLGGPPGLVPLVFSVHF